MPTSTVENYLKAILRLERTADGAVAVGRIASELEVTPGTVTTMMKHLGNRGLIDYTPRRGVSLRPEGREAAVRVVRRHRLVESFLVEVMQLDWTDVHEEAEVLEHVISDRLLARIDEMLDHPTHDPHGAPIPDARGNLPAQEGIPLSECEPGQYRLLRVAEDDAGFLEWLAQQKLKPGARLRLISHDHPAGLFRVLIHGRHENIQFGTSAAQRLLVKPTG